MQKVFPLDARSSVDRLESSFPLREVQKEESDLKPYYEHGGITIYHCDCREILPTAAKVDLVLTDPPYGINWSRGLNNKRGSKMHSGIVGDKDTSIRDLILAIYESTPALVFGSFYAAFPQNVKQVLIWKKPPDSGLVGSVTGIRRDAEPIFMCGEWSTKIVERSSIFNSSRGISAVTTETGHPHTKPLDILLQLIKIAPDGLILDPFMGSGTTLRAAKDLGRYAIGIEIEEKYCEIAAKRLSQEVLQFE